MAELLQGTPYARQFSMVLPDGITPATGKTPLVKLGKAGLPLAVMAGTVTEVGSGWYVANYTSADTAVLGDLAFHATATGAVNEDFCDQIVPPPPTTEQLIIQLLTLQNQLLQQLVNGLTPG